ncbi:MAG: hypothetical protein EBR82_70190 [Caulobacteraceae bacterium]|nr:hypothetical protein [Caulobacteraceae bacterium]
MRPRGGLIIGTLPTWTTTATSGIFTLREAQSMRSTAQWPLGQQIVTLTSGGGSNSWAWFNSNNSGDFSDGLGVYDDGNRGRGGWRTTFSPATKPSNIISATFSIGVGSRVGNAYNLVIKGANLDNAGQGLTGTSQTTESTTISVPSSGTMSIDVTAIVAAIVGRAGWSVGNAIVLYLLTDNASAPPGQENYFLPPTPTDTQGSLQIVYL